jgi:hypothetical protein
MKVFHFRMVISLSYDAHFRASFHSPVEKALSLLPATQ